MVYGAAIVYVFQSLSSYVGSEDCLHLDVYTPSLPSTAGLPSGTALHSAVDGARPVIVFLHGGSLIEGSVSPPYQSINPLDSLVNYVYL